MTSNQMMKKLNVVMIGPSLEEKGGMGSVETLILETTPPDVNIEHLSTWDGEHSTLKLFLQASTIFLGKLLTQKVDLVHLHVAERGSVLRKCALAIIAFAFNKPVIMHTHGCEFPQFYTPLPSGIKQLINWVFQHCNYVVVLSKSWQEFYITHCQLQREKVIVLPNPVDIPDEIPQRQHSQPVNFLFLGKINKRKGIYDLLEAFGKLTKEQREQAQIILAGSGEIDQARQVATTLGIENQVQFPGWITPAQRNELLPKADVFLLPSYNEGLPMALLEAMSWGLPVITTPVGGIPEVITDQETGLLVNPGDIEQLRIAMQSLMEDDSLRLSLGCAARKRVEPHDVSHYSEHLFRLYDKAKRRSHKTDQLTTTQKF
ncbi:MAG: glycosyltransferase family 4 protein [Halothece sp.]